MNNKFYKQKALKKVRFSLFIIAIYLIGSNIVIPGVDSQGLIKMMSNSLNISFGLSMMGISLNSFSLFSLGLAPWMSALIFWKVLTVTKLFNVENFEDKRVFHIKMIFSLSIGVIQSFAVIDQAKSLGGSISIPFYLLCTILLAGLTILIWLGELNAQHGLGGQTIIIIVTMLRNWPESIMKQLSGIPITVQSISKAIFFLLFTIAFLYGIFVIFQGERRLPVKHVLLDEKLSKDSYVPISTNPSGGMPFMYAFSIMQLPSYIIFGLKSSLGDNKVIDTLYNQLQLNQPLGVTLLIVTIILLTYGFSYVNVDYKVLANQMKKTGDYFIDVFPGKNTEKYLFDKITQMATISAVLNTIVIGGPMYFVIFFPKMSTWAYFVPTCIITIILMREIQVQFDSYYHRGDYAPIMPKNISKSNYSFWGNFTDKQNGNTQ